MGEAFLGFGSIVGELNKGLGETFQKLEEIAESQRFAEVVPLKYRASLLKKPVDLASIFGSLYDDTKIEVTRECDDGSGQGLITGTVGNSIDERLVDLDHVDRQILQIA